MIGAMYCSRPIVVSGIRTAAAPKRISGIAVTMPPLISSSAWSIPSVANVPLPLVASQSAHRAAGVNRNAVSIARLCVPPSPTCFFTSP